MGKLRAFVYYYYEGDEHEERVVFAHSRDEANVMLGEFYDDVEEYFQKVEEHPIKKGVLS